MGRPGASGAGGRGPGRPRGGGPAGGEAGFLLSAMRGEGKLLHAYRRGKTRPQSFLEDYSFLIAGLLDLHEATADSRWLAEAQGLARSMVADFWDENEGTFFATPR